MTSTTDLVQERGLQGRRNRSASARAGGIRRIVAGLVGDPGQIPRTDCHPAPPACAGFTLPNRDIVLAALLAVGGALDPVDAEFVAMRSAELAPGRFRWRHYPDQVDVESVRKVLRDLKRPSQGNVLVVGDASRGWLLNPRGVAAARSVELELRGKDSCRTSLPAPHPKRKAQEAARLDVEPAYVKARDGRIGEITRTEAEACFRLDQHAAGEAAEVRIARLTNLFDKDARRPALDAIAALLRTLPASI